MVEAAQSRKEQQMAIYEVTFGQNVPHYGFVKIELRMTKTLSFRLKPTGELSSISRSAV